MKAGRGTNTPAGDQSGTEAHDIVVFWDELLAQGLSRGDARAAVRAKVDDALLRWRQTTQ
jgi:hypothetical protein